SPGRETFPGRRSPSAHRSTSLQRCLPMPTLLVALDEGPNIPLDREPIVVGRHPHCDVRLPSFRVSRRHCCLTEVEGVVAVRDLGSLNGTQINGRRVDSGRLRPGDTLTLAHLRYRLENGREAESSPAAPQAGSGAETTPPCDPPSTRHSDECPPRHGPLPHRV